MPSQHNSNYASFFIGIDTKVPLLNGSQSRYVNLDNAASTPSLKSAKEAVENFLPYYSSVHRGNGYKSQLSTHVYETARDAILKFVNANPEEHICIFGKNTTDAINKLAHRFPFNDQRNIVIVSGMEHHSNDLPWRGIAKTIHVALTHDGRLDEADFDNQLNHYASRIALVALTGASNVTGFINPVHRLAEKTHAVGAKIFIDSAQLAPHRKVDVRPLGDPAHFDFVAVSGHKMYAPFGTGALIGRRDIFECGIPDQKGGGTVEIVTLKDVVWAKPPDRDEAGSPNTVGAVATAAAVQQLDTIGFDNIVKHEVELTKYALERLVEVPSVKIFGSTDSNEAQDRLGVIPFMVDGISHFKVASILGYEFGIGVRSGCFCAHPYILHLLQITQEESYRVREKILSGDKTDMPGLIRASFGLYNTRNDVDALVEGLYRIVNGDYQGIYIQDESTGEFKPRGWAPDFEHYFSIFN
jgi:cysteine desulfurase/selenocysteine lyase